jgi:hypothetical protein
MTEISPDLTSTLDQLKAVDERRRYLTERQHVMIAQVAHRAGLRWRAGSMPREEVLAFYSQLRDVSAVGFMKAWEDAGLPSARSLRERMRYEALTQPSEPDGSWAGSQPIGEQRRPPARQAVVYLLYDGAEPIYLGSTDRFVTRISTHRRDGKQFTSWHAWPCRDREHAYEREVEMLRQSLPRLNQRAGR